MPSQQARGWCGTIHVQHLTNPQEDVPVTPQLQHTLLSNWRTATLAKEEALLKDLVYAIFGLEVCPETRRPHIQYFCYFKKRQTRTGLGKTLGIKPHAEAIKGTPQENITYCSKDGDFMELGDKSKLPTCGNKGGNGRGRSNSSSESRELAVCTFKKRRTLKSLFDINVSYNNLKLVEALAKFEEPRATNADAVHVIWFFGPTGVGKSRAAESITDGKAFRPISHKWWEGYDGHRAIIIDDYRKDFCKFHELLKMLDIYPYRVETKGASRQCLASIFFITSPLSPEALWEGRVAEDLEQLSRRVHTVVEFLKEPALGSQTFQGANVFVRKGTLPDETFVRERLAEDDPEGGQDSD